jgi:hypothetical protein
VPKKPYLDAVRYPPPTVVEVSSAASREVVGNEL